MKNGALDDGNNKPILVSACLLGLPTRYDGKAKRSQTVMDFLQRENLLPIPVCPEQLAGEPVGEAADIYAFCISMRESLASTQASQTMRMRPPAGV